jgi:pyridoxamine 5'-phosphate oxidase
VPDERSDGVRPGREELRDRLARLRDRFDGGPIPRPGDWGGHVLIPLCIEFWQGRVDDLQDRFRFTRSRPGDPWSRRRIAP